MLGLIMSIGISGGACILAVYGIITIGEQVIVTILGWIFMVLVNEKG